MSRFRNRLTGRKTNPSGIGNDIPIPVTGSEQDDGSGDADATHKYADECYEPFWLQFRSEANLRPIVQGHAGPHQSQTSFS